MDIPARYVGLVYDDIHESWDEHDGDDQEPTHIALPLEREPAMTAIPISTEQTPLPFSVVLANNERPDVKVLAAMFAFEEDRDRYVTLYNLGLV